MFPSTDSGSGAAWPAIKPKKDLQINLLKGTQLLTVPDFLTSVGAKAFVDVAESMGFTHQGSLGPLKGEAYRDNDRISVTDPLLAQTLWESGINRIFMGINISGKVATGLNPNIRLYKYVEGQLFGRHIDESVNLGDGSRTQYTLLVYLSGKGRAKDSQALVGGETVFYDHRGGIVVESELLGHPRHEFEPSNYSATELSRRRARRPRAGGSPADRGDGASHLRRGGLQRRGAVLLQICVSVVHPVCRFPRRQRLYDRVLFLHVLSHEEMVERRTSNAQHLILLAELLFLKANLVHD